MSTLKKLKTCTVFLSSFSIISELNKRVPSNLIGRAVPYMTLKISELDVLMEELTGLEVLSEEEKANESKGKKQQQQNRKTEQDGVKALDMK